MTNKGRCVNHRKLFLYFSVVYILVTALFYWVGSEQMESIKAETQSVTPMTSDGGLVGTHVLEQKIQITTDTLDEIILYTGTYGRINESSITLELWKNSALLWTQEYDTGFLADQQWNAFALDTPLENLKGRELLLRIFVVDVPIDQAITLYFGNSYSAGKGEIPVKIDSPLVIDDVEMYGMLAVSLSGRNLLSVKEYYWPAVVLIYFILATAAFASGKKYAKNGTGPIRQLMEIKRYSFLIKQLISRDFKTKYKRSFLGVFWSFLNPLLTMLVQYLVFAQLFKSNIENFAIYLMTGIVIYNFFAESVGIGMSAIVSNASLITKVYVPKYIYPVSRVLSSSINIAISMIPLGIMMLVSGIPFHKSMLLLPVVLLYVIVFCIGMSLLLSSSMVFFRDTQFLWGIISMLWMYLTPLFYPESIIPTQFLTLYHMNPLYQFIYFMREITMNGVTPSPYTFLYCTMASAIPLLIGIYVFRKTQDRFVFYI